MFLENTLNDLEIKKLGFDEIKIGKLKKIISSKVNPYEYSFENPQRIDAVIKKYEKATHEKAKETVSLAGRIYAIRHHGKAIFADIRDFTGKIQLYLKEDELGREKFHFFKELIDTGDIIGLNGWVFRTKMGELTVWVNNYVLLSKSIATLPEKFHGLQDTERRYRERHLDLICNQETRDVFLKRAKAISKIRHILESKGFIEVETPILQPIYGGAKAKPFETYHNFLKQKLYLRIAPELYLKRLVVGGFEKVFEIAKNFRNESIDTLHNPEFTMIEIYETYKDYNGMMELTEELISEVIKETNGKYKIKFADTEIDFKPKWKIKSMSDLIKDFLDIDVESLSFKKLLTEAQKKGLKEAENIETKGELVVLLFENFVEDSLIQPTFVTEFPIEVSPLAKKSRDKNYFTERFELFVNGYELANGFSELNDPIEQKERLESQIALEKDNVTKLVDYDYIKALGYGLPPTGGVGIGIDRLIMFLANKTSIKEVILFPHMRPQSDV
ncbi:MAG: lysine--tRNA ligase [Candidatus Diapherotrites archaeon]|nr:lysine--tRNA ligase [Candidatus Diapherotrites archaeon]